LSISSQSSISGNFKISQALCLFLLKIFSLFFQIFSLLSFTISMQYTYYLAMLSNSLKRTQFNSSDSHFQYVTMPSISQQINDIYVSMLYNYTVFHFHRKAMLHIHSVSMKKCPLCFLCYRKTKNSSEDEIANVNFLYDDIVHAPQNTIDSCINSAKEQRGVMEHRFTSQ